MSRSGPRAPLALAASLAALLVGAPALAQNFLEPAPTPGAEPRMQRRAAESAAPPRSAVAGRYAPLRDGGKDTGCMLTLDGSARGPGGTNRAQLAPACRDQGLVIFDPVGWQIERGRLALTARKGHKAHFDRQPDGTWLRDPKEGKTLGLRPI